MPEKVIYVNGVGTVRFPDTMSEDVIASTIREKIIPQRDASQRAGGSSFGGQVARQFSRTPIGQAIAGPGEALSQAATTGLSDPVATVANVANAALRTGALPFTLADASLRQVGAARVADIAMSPFQAVAEGVNIAGNAIDAVLPDWLRNVGSPEARRAVGELTQGAAQILAGAGAARAFGGGSSVAPVPAQAKAVESVSSKRAVEAGVPKAVADVAKAGAVPVEQLSPELMKRRQEFEYQQQLRREAEAKGRQKEERGLAGTDPNPVLKEDISPDVRQRMQDILDASGVDIKAVGPDGSPLNSTSIMKAIEEWNHDKGSEKTWRAQALIQSLLEADQTGQVTHRSRSGMPEVRVPVDELVERKAMQSVGEGDVSFDPATFGEQPHPPKYAENINLNRLNIDENAKQRVLSSVKSIKPELQQVKGAALTNDEVVQAAAQSDVLRKVVTRDETKAFLGELTALRQAVAAGATGKGVSADFIGNLKTLSSQAADAGRKLQAFSIDADPVLKTAKEAMVQKLIDLGIESDKIVKAAENVDFGDARQAIRFYREFVKPTVPELIKEFRYINMLSSPLTHIVNTFNNITQAVVLNPATKLATGPIDRVFSTLRGRPREYYSRESTPYMRGMVNSLPQAWKEAARVMSGEQYSIRPDVFDATLQHLPSMGESASAIGKPIAKFNQSMGFILRFLEAQDIFFQTAIRAGEREALAYHGQRRGKAADPAVIDAEATRRAKRFVFRDELDPSNKSGQGALLSKIDKATSEVMSIRNKFPSMSWVIPFVQTSMNILKQGIEYSPAGVMTLKGSKYPVEQLGKAAIGSMVFAGASSLVATNDSTWEPPKGDTAKKRFYDEGKIPYAIKIGDTWVSYSKLGPLAYPIALAAATKYYSEQAPNADNRATLEKVGQVIMANAKFLSDQSYMQGIGNLVSIAEGESSAYGKAMGDYASQLIPLSSLQAWVARIFDPKQRKAKGPLEQMQYRIPLFREGLPELSSKETSVGQRFVGAVSPVRVSPDATRIPAYR